MDDIQPYEDDYFYDALGMRVWQQRHLFVDEVLTKHAYTRILDLGCNDAKFLQRMSRSCDMHLLAGCDIDPEALSSAKLNLYPEPLQMTIKPYRKHPLEVHLYNADILKRFSLFKQLDFQAVTLIEVIEHLHMRDLPSLEMNLFGYLQTPMVIVTTPNRDFNSYFPNPEDFRHDDHKFEWTRQQFNDWCLKMCNQYPYSYEIHGVGWHKNGYKDKGPCSQVGVFRLKEKEKEKEGQMEEEAESPELVEKFKYPFDYRSKEEKIVDEVKYQMLSLEEEDVRYCQHQTWKRFAVESLTGCHRIKELESEAEKVVEVLRRQEVGWIKEEDGQLWFLVDESESEGECY